MTNKQVQFKIDGMHCNSCNELITEICEDSGAIIEFNKNNATVEYDETKTNLLELIKEIERENFSISNIKLIWKW